MLCVDFGLIDCVKMLGVLSFGSELFCLLFFIEQKNSWCSKCKMN